MRGKDATFYLCLNISFHTLGGQLLPLQELKNAPKVIGLKQVKKAIDKSQVKRVYIASDAEPHVIAPIKNACTDKQIEITMVESMGLLGKACGIEVGSATVALLID